MSGALGLFYIGTNDSLYCDMQDPNRPDVRSGETWLGGAAKSLAVARNADGRLEIFYIGTDDNLYHN